MAWAVIDIEPVKGREAVRGRGDHNRRARQPSNADPARSHMNQILIGPDAGDLGALAAEKIGAQKLRRDARWACEMILSASPEYFRPGDPAAAGTWDDTRLKTWTAASHKWLQANYGNNIISAVVHLDETTPHIHAIVMPLRNNGSLSYKAFFDGPQRLRDMHTSYAKAMQHLGIERGREGSKATAEDVKDYYRRVIEAKQLAQTLDDDPEPLRLKWYGWSTKKVQQEVDKARDEERQKADRLLTAYTQISEKFHRQAATLHAKYQPEIDKLQAQLSDFQTLQKYYEEQRQAIIKYQQTLNEQARKLDEDKNLIELYERERIDIALGVLKNDPQLKVWAEKIWAPRQAPGRKPMNVIDTKCNRHLASQPLIPYKTIFGPEGPPGYPLGAAEGRAQALFSHNIFISLNFNV